MAFYPDESIVATAGQPDEVRLRVLDEKGPKSADSPNRPRVAVSPRALAFSPDGKWLAIGGKGNRIQLWKTSGRDIFLENRGDEVRSLAFSPEGEWLAAGGADGTIQLWRWAGDQTKPTPIVLTGHAAAVTSLAFTPRGLVSASVDHTVRTWELRPEKLLQRACQSAGRTLSGTEWKTYILSEAYKEDDPCHGLPKAPE